MKMHYHRSYDRAYGEKDRLDWQLIKRLTAYLLPFKALLLTAILLLVISKGIEAYVPIAIGHLTDRILNVFDSTLAEKKTMFVSFSVSSLTILCLLVIAYILDTINVFLKNWVGQEGLFRLRMEVYRHIESLPIQFFNKTAVGTLMTRTIHDIDQVNQMFAEGIVPILGSVFLFLSILVGLIATDFRAALVLFAVLPFVFFLTNFFRKNQRRCYDLIRGIVSTMNAFVQEHLMGATTIRSFGLQEMEKKQFEEINHDHRNANVETIHYFAYFFAGIDFIQSMSLILVFIVLVQFSPPGEPFNVGTYFTFSLYVLMLFRPLADLAERYNLLQSAMAASVRIFRVLDEEEEPFDQGKKSQLTEIKSIEFDDVWFAYKDGEWILKGLNFSCHQGESIALVGMTGAGKTTILNLLLRFYDIQKGAIRINGKDIKDYPLKVLRGQFSVVLQDPEIFSGSFFENISLGNPLVGKEKVEEVIDFVHLRPLVNSYRQQIYHNLSERGKSLSAGQRQLVSLARAVAHDNSVFVLDEATANIDTTTEKVIQEVLEKILGKKTSIVIAHRLSTIKDVDRILVLHDGQVKEKGTHQELLAKKGFYEKLYRLQFS